MCTQTSKGEDRETRELAILYELAQWLSRSRSLDEVAAPLLRRMEEDMEMTRGTITILNRDADELTIEAAHGLSPEQRSRGRYKPGEGITGLVVQTGRPAVVPRISQEPLFLDRTGARSQDRVQGHNDLSFICVPIRLTQDMIGALSVDRVYSDDTAYSEDVRLLTIMAAMVAYPARQRQAGLERRQAQEERDVRFRGGENPPAADSAVQIPLPASVAMRSETVGLEAVLNALEQEMISDALKASRGNMTAAARRLGLTERVMGLRVHKHGIDLKRFKRQASEF
jgi:transcriptional regulator with GAF, ATPase, and Fis domain